MHDTRLRAGHSWLPYSGWVLAARDYSDLHELVNGLEPGQAGERQEHAQCRSAVT